MAFAEHAASGHGVRANRVPSCREPRGVARTGSRHGMGGAGPDPVPGTRLGPMSTSRVCAAYSERADEYIEACGSMGDVHPEDLALVRRFAKLAGGRIVDAGCGPGHWTDFLQEHGSEVEGVDLSPAFIDRARQRFPLVPFRVGNLEALGMRDGSVAGILSWYSIIHTQPRDVGTILREFARCVTAGGLVLLGFFDGPAVQAFEHQVVTAYRWPVQRLCGELEAAGFAILEVHTRADPGHRPHGAILARKPGPGSRGTDRPAGRGRPADPAPAPWARTISAA